jgi:hypothetical protein
MILIEFPKNLNAYYQIPALFKKNLRLFAQLFAKAFDFHP